MYRYRAGAPTLGTTSTSQRVPARRGDGETDSPRKPRVGLKELVLQGGGRGGAEGVRDERRGGMREGRDSLSELYRTIRYFFLPQFTLFIQAVARNWVAYMYIHACSFPRDIVPRT